MKKILLLNSITIAILGSSQSIAIEKNIDFYNTKTIASFEGKLNEFKNISFNNNIIYLDEVEKETFIRLNDKSGDFYSYNHNNNIYNILKNNLGENIKYKNSNIEDYKIFKIEEPFVILESNKTIDNESLIYVNEIKDLFIPKKWFNISNSYKVKFKENIKDTDKVFYSYENNELSNLNKYDVIIKSDKDLTLTHFIEIENNGNPYSNVNLSFFHGDINIKKQNEMVMYAKSNMAMESMESNNFSENHISDIKVIGLDNVYLNTGLNKFKYKEIDFKYDNYVKIESEYIFINPFYNNMDINSFRENINFKNYIGFDVKNNIFPSGKVNVYNKNKLIISDTIIYIENEPLSLYKSKNKDLKVQNILLENIDENRSKIIEVMIKNTSNKNYNIKFNNMNFEIKPYGDLNIKVNK